jgi:AmiR/NasT family two-component response regulator
MPRVLIIEANPAINGSMRVVLEAAGFEVTQAFDHHAARLVVETRPPSFALLDLSPSQPDAMDLARVLARSRVPFVVLSAHADSELIQHAVDAGAIGYFVNLLDLSVIVPSIRAWIARAGEFRQVDRDQWSLLEALRHNRSIGTAVGMIMERHQLTSNSAFEALRREARNKRLSLVRLAAQIVSGLVELHLPLRAGATRA